MLKRISVALLLGLIGAGAGGCSTPSINPIYSEDAPQSELITDDRVVGVWFQNEKDKDKARYHVGKRTDEKSSVYPVSISEGPVSPELGGKWGRFELRLVKLGAHMYADFLPEKAERDRLGGRFGLAALPMHVIMPVTVSADRVTLRPVHPEKVRVMLEAAPLMTPHAVRDKIVILTGDTPRVQQFFRKIADGDEAFGDTIVLTRVKEDAASP